MAILDDEFKISNYLNNSKQKMIIDQSDLIEKAIEWSKDTTHAIIIPTGDLEDLENQWIEFNSMPIKHRRESDWNSIELFGDINYNRYNALRAMALRNDIPNEIEQDFDNLIQDTSVPVTESYFDSISTDPYYDTDTLNYSTLDVEKAKKWANESNRVIITPTKTLSELENLWDSFNTMHHKHCRESDWMSLELFGLTNLKHYEYLKNQFLQRDINISDADKYGSVVEGTDYNMRNYFAELCRTGYSVEVIKSLLELSLPAKNISEESITNNVISDTLDTFIGLSTISPDTDIPYGDLPFFSPNDMIDMGINASIPEDNYYGVFADNTHISDDITVAEWFEMYKATYDGFYTEFTALSSNWVNTVRNLMHGLSKLKESGNEKAINARKQSILELGWNPDIEFNNKARLIARESTIHKMTSRDIPTRMVDLCGFSNPVITNNVLNEDVSKDIQKKLYPVFIVLTEGKSAFSTAIKGITHSIYSHASIAFDSTLTKMYSFGVNTNSKIKTNNGIRGGFREENINDIHEGGRLGVFTFFVSLPIYNKIVEMVESFKNNAHNTGYGYANIITFLFNIPYNRDWRLICSQFVDRCLKIADIDITKKNSSLVAPEDFNKAAKAERTIYTVYQGLASKYNPSNIKRLINALSKKAIPIKENQSIYYRNETSYITGIISNINNITVLKEMQYHIDIVQNESIKRLLNETLFDSLEARAYCEAKEFPVQFDKEGNLLIKNIKRIDYEAEYAKSHRLLKQYQKSNNIDGIKYELSKLWMMICLIEDKLNSKKFKELPSFAIESSTAHKARAKIINDFQYYLSEVMENDPEFNFTEYYDNSPFSSTTTKINAPTLTFVGKMIKGFVKSMI